MKTLKFFAASFAFLASLSGAAMAQSCPGLSVSVQAFTPTGEASLAVSGISNSVALTTNGSSAPSATTVVVTNLGANTAFVSLGDASVSATSQAFPVLPSSSVTLAIRANTFIAGIATAGNTVLRVSTGY